MLFTLKNSFKYIKLLFFLICIFNILSFSKNDSTTFINKHKNFNYTKKIAQKIHMNAPGTFYCGCKIDWTKKRGIPNLNSCGYHIRKNINRAHRIEWEHVVPAWQFGHLKTCWKHGGRKNCNHDQYYKNIETDLHNLQPIIGEINGDRSNFIFNQIDKNYLNHQYGNCSMKINFKKKVVEPPNTSKGAIARIYLYMNDMYKLNLSNAQIQLFKRWNKQFKVTNWECIRDNLIFQTQGNHNKFVYSNCKK